MKRETILKICQAFIGNTILAAGVALSTRVSMGADPYTALNTAMSNLLGMSLGTYQLLFNLLIMVFIFFLGKELIGIGTVINMVAVGYLIQGFDFIWGQWITGDETFVLRIFLLIVALILFDLGAGLYIEAQIGIAPYDAIAPLIVKYSNISFSLGRTIQDIIFLSAAFFLKGPVFVMTFIAAFFNGPLIQFFSERVGKPIRLYIESNNK